MRQRTLDRLGNEYEIVASVATLPKGRVTFDGGRTGRHMGDGVVMIWGDGEHYGYLGHCRTCDRGVTK